MDPYKILKYPVSTEKAVREMELSNIIIFVVARNTTKAQIKSAVQELYKVKVKNIRTVIGSDNVKKAFIKLSEETPAIDIATDMGLV